MTIAASFAQKKSDLEKQKKKKKQEIAYTNKLLREIKSSSEKTYNELLLLDRKITLRQELIYNISQEIKLIEERIAENDMVIKSLEADLIRLKNEYAKMIYYAYKNRNSYNRLMFIISAENFNQAYKRLKYLQYYSRFRKKQKEFIIKTQEELQAKLAELKLRKEDKQNLINSQQEEGIIMEMEKTERNGVLNNLKSREVELKKQLAQHQRAAAKLQKAIQKILEEEAKKAAERSKNKTGDFALTPEERLISDSFGSNKGRLPWPTERGEITGTFGEHEHPVLPGIKVRNNGVDISTTKAALVRTLFEGEVREIIDIPGANKAIIVRHGNYLTVYQNLDQVFVSKSDKVEAKQSLGRIYTKPSDNTTTLHIEIWKENTKLNPSFWLSGK